MFILRTVLDWTGCTKNIKVNYSCLPAPRPSEWVGKPVTEDLLTPLGPRVANIITKKNKKVGRTFQLPTWWPPMWGPCEGVQTCKEGMGQLSVLVELVLRWGMGFNFSSSWRNTFALTGVVTAKCVKKNSVKTFSCSWALPCRTLPVQAPGCTCFPCRSHTSNGNPRTPPQHYS